MKNTTDSLERLSPADGSPVRVQLRRTKGWKMPTNTVKVDRATKWGNPFRVGQPGIATAQDAVDRFILVHEAPEFRLIREEIRRELRGKNLACWCKRAPCHADVLLRLANGKLSQPAGGEDSGC